MINYSKYLKIIFASIMLISMSSCLKKDGIPDLSSVAPVIEFPLGGPGLVLNRWSNLPKTKTDTAVALNIASPDPLNQDATIKVKVDASVVDAYNVSKGTTYVAIPASAYTIESTDIVIKAGYRIGRVKIKLNFDQFDASKKYVLGLSISDAPSGMIISGNYGKYLWAFF